MILHRVNTYTPLAKNVNRDNKNQPVVGMLASTADWLSVTWQEHRLRLRESKFPTK